jgi:hypothetical protein
VHCTASLRTLSEEEPKTIDGWPRNPIKGPTFVENECLVYMLSKRDLSRLINRSAIYQEQSTKITQFTIAQDIMPRKYCN